MGTIIDALAVRRPAPNRTFFNTQQKTIHKHVFASFIAPVYIDAISLRYYISIIYNSTVM